MKAYRATLQVLLPPSITRWPEACDAMSETFNTLQQDEQILDWGYTLDASGESYGSPELVELGDWVIDDRMDILPKLADPTSWPDHSHLPRQVTPPPGKSALKMLADRIEAFRADLLFGDDKVDDVHPGASRHYLIALSLLDQAHHHMALADMVNDPT